MSYNRIAILAALRTELVNGTANPTPGLAQLAARLIVDDANKTLVYKIADRRPMAATLLWTRIADHLNGQPRIEALTLAAVFALKAGNPGISATLITRVQVTAAAREHTEIPPIIGILQIDHRVRHHLPHAVA